MSNVDEVTETPSAPRRAPWRFPWVQAVATIAILAGVAIALYPQTAAWFTQKNQSRVIENSVTVVDGGASSRHEQLVRAGSYNDVLASGAQLGANANLPASVGQSSSTEFVYDDLLVASDEGVMGRLRYNNLGIDLPIYHGTSDETLLKGVGHLEGTSLPVGGADSRAVLTAHRGLATATMFDNLDKAKVGDTFVVEVLGEVLTYRVRDTKVIEPDQTEMLMFEPGQDLVTLVTCTPLGINTQRILVTGERVTPTPIADLTAGGAPSELPGFPWWAVVMGITLTASGGYLWWSGYPARAKTSADVIRS